MKKVFCVFMAIVLCFSMTSIVSATEQEFSVEDVATYFLNDALAQPNEFRISGLNGKNIYLCNAINPYVFDGNELQPDYDVECYLVKTDDEIIASITLCYADGALLSASLDTYIAEVINANSDIDEAFQLIGQDGTLYVKTADKVGTSNTQTSTRMVNIDTVAAAIEDAEGNLETLSVKSQLTRIVADPIVVRSSKILNVPYVAQGYNTCWAAAAAAFGQYYTGSTYAHYTADELAETMGLVGKTADMITTKKLLTNVFNLSTTYYGGRLSDSVTINLFQQGKPIIAGFQGDFGWHMVVLCGYDDHATGVDITFYVRDSNYTYLRSVISYSDNDDLAMYYYGDVKTWEEGLY